jgi:hypothetical protein
MVDNPISNPGVPPIQPTKGPDRQGPSPDEVRPGEFTMPEGPGKTSSVEGQRPSPMEVAGDAAKQQQPIPQEELGGQISKLHDQLGDIKDKLQTPNVTQKLTSDHYEAMQKVTQKMNPDFANIAKSSNGQYSPPQPKTGQGSLEFVTKWIDGAQGTLGGALNYLQNTKKPDIASYLRMQYAVQRATQRGELFASIIGSSVSGIKTIMSTQLG